jgi:hypothetical protein
MSVPEELRPYLGQLVHRLGSVLEDRLQAVYGLGSLALGAYRAPESDLDIYVIAAEPVPEAGKLAVAEACRHASLPCPARRLELVVITAAEAAAPGAEPRWELNLNTGAGEADHIGLDPRREPSHWFVLDLAIAHQHGLALWGPPSTQLVGAPALADVRQAHAQAVGWYAGHGTPLDTITAACRAWHWRDTGAFAGKGQAVRWAMARLDAGGAPGHQCARRAAR